MRDLNNVMAKLAKKLSAVVNVLIAKRAVDLACKPLNALKERYRGFDGSNIDLSRINLVAMQDFRHPTPSTANP